MAITQGGSISPVAAPRKQALAQNYIDFTSTGSNSANWAQQHMPDIAAAEAERYGKRTISGFLSQVGAEEGMTSDQVVWSEQGRLHLKYTAIIKAGSNSVTLASSSSSLANHAVRVGDTIIISNNTRNKTTKAYVTNVATTEEIVVAPYLVADLNVEHTAADVVTIFVYGNEFTKGTAGRAESVSPEFKSFSNQPIIIKDKYHVNGSDTAQIGWVEVTGEEGQSGYMWYLKADGDTKARFTDYLEMSMVEAELKGGSGHASAPKGSEGLFAAITDRGLYTNDTMSLATFDLILAEFDGQGAIEENMMYLNRAAALTVDDFLSDISIGTSGGTAFGLFNNSESMALNLGFTGFRRGSYDFYKTDWKYLNDSVTRGSVVAANTASVRGVVIPAGVSSVYDENLGKNLKRPFLHVRYRTSDADDRRFKTWITGSVGGNITSDLDAMEVHYLSERCLVVQAANNFLLLN